MSSLLKRFLLFQGDVYYPGSGFCDFVDSFDTKEEAEAHPAYKYGMAEQWAEVVDTWSADDVAPVQSTDSWKWCQWKEYKDDQGKD